MEPSGVEAPSTASLGRACAFLALAVPLVLTVLRAEAWSDWQSDVAAVTGLGVLPLGSEGWLSLVGAQAASLLPVGGRWLRAAWIGAIATACASRLIYALALRLLGASARAPSLSPPLALAAALTAVLTPSFQFEGASLGGAALATAAALAGLVAFVNAPPRDARAAVLAGALVALTAVESHVAALSLAGALGVAAFARRSFGVIELAAALGGALAVVASIAAAFAVRLGSPHAWLDLGFGLGQSSLSTLSASALRSTAFSAWLGEVGPAALGLAVGGTVVACVRRETRWMFAPLVVLVVADLGLPSRELGALTADASAPARLLAISALAVAAGLGVQSAALALLRARLPFATPAAVLLVVFDFTLVLVGSEASATEAERRRSSLSEEWSDEALASLPPRSLILGRSEAVAFHLWAAQLVRGERPELVVVPTSLLERGGLRRRLVYSEPALAPLLRDIALGGRPGEYALSTLADARPLFVELDPSWDERLNQHLLPAAFWLRFSPHPVGRSDRTVAFGRAERRLERLWTSATELGRDQRAPATRAVMTASLRQRALFLAGERDRETALKTSAALRALDPSDEVAAEIDRRFSKDKKVASAEGSSSR